MGRSIFYFSAVVVVAASNFAVNYILSQKLELAQYGTFSLISAILPVVLALFVFGQAPAITMVYFSEEKRNCRDIASEVASSIKIILISTVGFAVLGAAVWFAHYRDRLGLAAVMLTITAAFAMTMQAFFVCLLNCMDRYREYFAATCVGAVALVAASYALPTVEGYLIAVSLGGVVTTVAVLKSVRRALVSPACRSSKTFDARELVGLGWIAVPGVFITAAAGFADKFIMSRLLTLSDVAVYALATTLALGVGRVVTAGLLKSSNILLYSHLQTNDRAGATVILRRTELTFCALCVLAAVLYYAAAEPVIVRVFGEKFRSSIPLLLPLFVAVLVEGMGQFLVQILVQRRKLYLPVLNATILLAIAVTSNFALIPHMLIRGAVLTLFIVNAIGLMITYAESRQLVPWIRFPSLFGGVSAAVFALGYWVPVH